MSICLLMVSVRITCSYYERIFGQPSAVVGIIPVFNGNPVVSTLQLSRSSSIEPIEPNRTRLEPPLRDRRYLLMKLYPRCIDSIE
jgi:hypothetical protein